MNKWFFFFHPGGINGPVQIKRKQEAKSNNIQTPHIHLSNQNGFHADVMCLVRGLNIDNRCLSPNLVESRGVKRRE